MIIKVILILLCNIVSVISAGLKMPDRINNDWVLQVPNKVYFEKELFKYIDGGAEIFREFGFENLTLYKYNNNNNALEIEVYKMENTQAALGIYLMKTHQEFPVEEISARNTANPYQIVITSGRFFIQVNNFSGNSQLRPLMIKLSQILIDQIHEPDTSGVLTYLPPQNMIEGSEAIFRGPIGLQSIYTFGKGDILLLGGKIFGASADYTTASSKNMTQLVIVYPDLNAAFKAYNNLILNLDPALKIVEKFKDNFIFEDHNNEFGWVKFDNNQLKIQIHLTAKP